MAKTGTIAPNAVHLTRRDALIASLAGLAGLHLPSQAFALAGTPPVLAKPVTMRLGLFKGAYTAAFEDVPAILAATNLKLEIADFVRYADARTALTTGSLDVATISVGDLLIALNQGADGIVALAGVAGSPRFMVVRNGVTVEKWEDLKGKRIGIAPGSSTWFQFTGKMKDLGIPFDSFTSVNIQGAGSNFLIALKRNDIDVALTWEPFESEPIVEGYGYWPKLDYSDSVAVGGETGLIACTKAFIGANSDAVRLLLWAFLKSEASLRGDKAKFAEVVARYTGATPAVSALIADKIKLGGVITMPQLQAYAKAFYELGTFKKDVSGEVGAHLDTSFVKSVST
jgi:sulfonate transport system substrate-binding protein